VRYPQLRRSAFMELLTGASCTTSPLPYVTASAQGLVGLPLLKSQESCLNVLVLASLAGACSSWSRLRPAARRGHQALWGCDHPPEGHRESSKPRGRRQSARRCREVASKPFRHAGREQVSDARGWLRDSRPPTSLRAGGHPGSWPGMVPLCPRSELHQASLGVER
jgi:hypothetical protein